MKMLGIDIGGSGIKGAPVDVGNGVLVAERLRIPTPQPAVPESVAEVVQQIVRHFEWSGPVGCAFPAAIKEGVALTAANVDPSWLGANVRDHMEKATGGKVAVLNDADAAGLAEMEFGAGKGERGTVFLLTLGTGIGSAIFREGILVPNTELGHLEIRGKDAETRASDRAREEKDLGWKTWAKRVNEVLDELEALFFPDLFILGGGVSKKHEKFIPLLETRARVVPAQLRNEAGIIGAALAARA